MLGLFLIYAQICPADVSEIHPGQRALSALAEEEGALSKWWSKHRPAMEEIRRRVFGGLQTKVALTREPSGEFCADGAANLYVIPGKGRYRVAFCPGMLALLARMAPEDWIPIVTLLFSHELGHVAAFERGEEASEIAADDFAGRRLAEISIPPAEMYRGLRFLCGYPSTGSYPPGRDRINSIIAAWKRAGTSETERGGSPTARPAPARPAAERSDCPART